MAKQSTFKTLAGAARAAGDGAIVKVGDVYVVGIDSLTEIAVLKRPEPKGSNATPGWRSAGYVSAGHLSRLGNANHAAANPAWSIADHSAFPDRSIALTEPRGVVWTHPEDRLSAAIAGAPVQAITVEDRLCAEHRPTPPYRGTPATATAGKFCETCARLRVERLIAERVTRDLIAAGFALDVFDGEETTLKNSREVGAVMPALMTTDEDHLIARRPEAPSTSASVLFVYGNGGFDVISDYSVSLEPVIGPIMAAIEADLENVGLFAASARSTF
jgi:hypothetical protein